MVPVISSLKGDRAFQRLRRGRAGHAKLLSLRWRASRLEGVRVGIVVSKKVGNAVVRNRVRRRLKEALRAILSYAEKRGAHSDTRPDAAELKVGPKSAESSATNAVRSEDRGAVSACELVVIARPGAAEASYQQLKGSLEHALRKGQLL